MGETTQRRTEKWAKRLRAKGKVGETLGGEPTPDGEDGQNDPDFFETI